MTTRRGKRWTLVALLSLLVGLLTIPIASAAPAAANGNTVFSGQATVVSGTVLGIPVTLVDTGPVAAEGGSLEATLLCYPTGPSCAVGAPDLTNGAVQAEVLHAAAIAGGNTSRSEASVASFNLTVPGHSVSAEFLMARAAARCNDGTASVSGSSEIAALTIDGQSVPVTGEANQKVSLPDGSVIIINQQVGSATANKGDFTVNALHVVVPGVADVVVASAHADIICANPASCQSRDDFVTGGGWIPASGSKATFGVAGGNKNGSLWGHLSYIDHGNKIKVKGTGVTAYVVTGPTSRHIEGTAEINGVPGTYRVDVTDNGEPGRNDTFAITFSTGGAAGTLGGGNIQLHGCG